MEHLERSSLGVWDSCYADIKDNQNSGNKSSQTHDIAVSIGQSSITKLAKKSKDKKTPTTIIVSNLNLSETFHHYLVNMIF